MRTLSRPGVVLALAGLAVAAVLIARAGKYPAVMTGDEIWFSESAFNFLRHGIPERLIHDDTVGSARADFLPPIIMLVQALGFALLGLTPLAVALQSILAPLGAIALITAIARRAGAPLGWAGAAGMALLGSQIFLRAGLYIRYEALVALFFLLYLLATILAEARARASPWQFLRGIALALAGLSYYPLAPFAGIAALAFEVGRPLTRARLLPAAIGFALPALAFATYVARFPDIFAAQIIGNGESNYVTFELLKQPLDPALWRQSKDAIPELFGLATLLVILLARWRRESPWVRRLTVALLITCPPILIFPFQPRLLALPVALALLVLAAWATSAAPTIRRIGRAALVAGLLAAGASASLMLATSWLQREARDYGAVEAALDRLISQPGAAAIDQRAWLALRAADPTRELDHAMPHWAAAQVRIFESRALRDPAGGEHFRYVVLPTADAEATIRATPALATAFAAGTFVEIGHIALPFRSLPWAAQAPYDLTIYERR